MNELMVCKHSCDHLLEDWYLGNRVHNIWYAQYSKLQLTFASPKWHILELQLVAVTNDKLIVPVFAVFDLGF